MKLLLGLVTGKITETGSRWAKRTNAARFRALVAAPMGFRIHAVEVPIISSAVRGVSSGDKEDVVESTTTNSKTGSLPPDPEPLLAS